jgi:hypothetical protein
MQYTIRQVPEAVDARLRAYAASHGVSLNKAAVTALAKGVGIADTAPLQHDLDEFCGGWKEDPEFETAIRSFEAVDETLWK